MITSAFKQRIVGAIFILSLGVILIPVILDTPQEEAQEHFSEAPEAPPLPQINEVAKINYVFNEMEEGVHAEPQVKEPESAPQVLASHVEEPAPVETTQEPIQVQAQAQAPASKVLGDWTIQLGAFSSTENANELLARLTKEGFKSYTQQTPGRHLVRVFVAPGIDKDEAQALLAKLDSQLGIKGILVRYREE